MEKQDEILYIPKGGMCRVCAWSQDDCSNYHFDLMKPLEKVYEQGEHTMTVVKCNVFVKG